MKKTFLTLHQQMQIAAFLQELIDGGEVLKRDGNDITLQPPRTEKDLCKMADVHLGLVDFVSRSHLTTVVKGINPVYRLLCPRHPGTQRRHRLDELAQRIENVEQQLMKLSERIEG